MKGKGYKKKKKPGKGKKAFLEGWVEKRMENIAAKEKKKEKNDRFCGDVTLLLCIVVEKQETIWTLMSSPFVVVVVASASAG